MKATKRVVLGNFFIKLVEMSYWEERRAAEKEKGEPESRN